MTKTTTTKTHCHDKNNKQQQKHIFLCHKIDHLLQLQNIKTNIFDNETSQRKNISELCC